MIKRALRLPLARQRMARIDRGLGKVEARLTAVLGRLHALRRRARHEG